MRILVLGVSGMLGNAVFRYLSNESDFQVYGTARSESTRRLFSDELANKITFNVDVENLDSLTKVFLDIRPNVVVNCVGLIKQLSEISDPLITLPVNAILPHRLAKLSALINSRFIHISTDCVFSGAKGGYKESDFPDANDLYGRSKLLGEVSYSNSITLRTSMIGHELSSQNALINWFLSAPNPVRGYTKAIFSGLPTVELAKIIKNNILPNDKLSGIFHVAATPISKFELLKLVAEVYGKKIEIIADESVVVDRSLDACKFAKATGYIAPTWPELIARMHEFK